MGGTTTEAENPVGTLDFYFFIGSTYTYLSVR